LLDLSFQVFEFVVVSLVCLLHFVDRALQSVLFRRPNDFSVVVHQTPHGILLPDLLNAVGALFNLVASLVNTCAQMLATCVLVLKCRSVVIHSFIFAVRFPEMFEGLRSICQVLKSVGLVSTLNHLLWDAMCLLDRVLS